MAVKSIKTKKRISSKEHSCWLFFFLQHLNMLLCCILTWNKWKCNLLSLTPLHFTFSHESKQGHLGPKKWHFTNFYKVVCDCAYGGYSVWSFLDFYHTEMFQIIAPILIQYITKMSSKYEMQFLDDDFIYEGETCVTLGKKSNFLLYLITGYATLSSNKWNQASVIIWFDPLLFPQWL